MKFKFWSIRIVIILLFGGLIANIYRIQISKGDYYTQQAQAQQEASGVLEARRGQIYFTDKFDNAIQVVLNKEYPKIYAVPKEIKDDAQAAQLLAPIVGKSSEELTKAFSNKKDQYELLVEKATQEQVDAIHTRNIPGVYIKDELYRFYPFGESGSHVLGVFAAGDDGATKGRYGIELQFDKELQGVAGKAIGDIVQNPENGKSIHLTLDRNIQVEGEKIIKDLMKAWNADGASVIVQDPKTGAIRAMANLPGFDPNDYKKSDVRSFMNDSIQSVYEPGSVFKIVTMAAGIDSGKITPQTTYMDTGSVTINKRTIKNWDLKAHGLQTMTGVIEQSLNTGTIFAERTTGHATFMDYVKKFGFGEKTKIQLPGEVKGSLGNLDNGKGQDVNYATASFGQGISVTPLQMISAASAIANGGLLVKPLIIKDEEQEIVRRVISKETSEKVINMMVSAVDKNVVAHIPNYNVAGKTGTAFIPDFKHGGYSDNVINTYIGFAPATDPKFVILIKLVNPSNAPLAGQTVVPAFKKLAEFLLNYYQIPPDRQTATQTPAATTKQQ